MAIKNPNPNIKDFEINDNTTWSSAHIAAGLQAAGVAVGPDGEVIDKPYDLIYDETLTEDKTSITFTGVSYKEIIAVIIVKYTATSTASHVINVKTPESSAAFFPTSAYVTRSFTADTSFTTFLKASCYGSLIDGSGVVSNSNSYASLSKWNATTYLSNIIGSNFTDIELKSTTTDFPTGTKIKIYAR